MMRGEIYWADYGIPYGSEPGFRRPVIIVQNNIFNIKELRTVLALPLTTNLILSDIPGNVLITKTNSGLLKDSVAVVCQTSVIDKSRLVQRVGMLPLNDMIKIDAGLRLIFALD